MSCLDGTADSFSLDAHPVLEGIIMGGLSTDKLTGIRKAKFEKNEDVSWKEMLLTQST